MNKLAELLKHERRELAELGRQLLAWKFLGCADQLEKCRRRIREIDELLGELEAA